MEESTSRPGLIGIAAGAAALLLVLVHFRAGLLSPQPKLESTVAEKAVLVREVTVAALKGEEVREYATPYEMNPDKAFDITGAVPGGIAVVLGVPGFAKKESARVAGGAVVLGAGAIAFLFAALAIGAIIVAIPIAAVIFRLGIS